MNIQEIQENISDIQEISQLSNFSEHQYSHNIKVLELNDYIIYEVELVNNSYDSSYHNTSIELNNVRIGDLYYLKDKKIEISMLSEFQFYSFINECSIENLRHQDYIFKNNYLIIHKDYIEEFHNKYSFTSSIWGGFKLFENNSSINYYTKVINNIIISDELRELDTYAKDSIIRALGQRHSFERFLKLYHLLELEFDNSLIQKIKNLDVTTQSNQIGVLLNDYNKSELDRLTDLIINCNPDISKLADNLNRIKSYKNLGEEIFITFGKSNKSNLHLTNSDKYRSLLNDPSAFSCPASVKNNIGNIDYDKFIINITAYWIYRIRCSIAHFKIGEYILTREKEDFIVEFAEPLIKEVLIQFYKI